MCRVSLRLSNASGGAEGSQELRHTILRGTLRSGSEIAEVSDHRISVIGGFELRLTAFCLILNGSSSVPARCCGRWWIFTWRCHCRYGGQISGELDSRCTYISFLGLFLVVFLHFHNRRKCPLETPPVNIVGGTVP